MSNEAMKLALEALKQIDEAMPFPVAKLAQAALREALAEQPAQRKPLTDEEIESINVRLAGSRDLARLFARAIEAAHGIKENT